MRLLEKMVKNLQDRSCVQKVFVLTSSNAHQSIKKRDRNGKIVEKTDGTTQDLLQYLKTTKKRVILVVLDYAGLTTNTEDLRDFLREYTNVVQIIVDRLPVTTEVEIFNTKLLLEDREAIKRFDCRTPPVHRSA
ncbi:hypothetical protein FB192DRAFT_1380265 [Mucor lusitanicus]|nr:hypothetical protein FB192DRAFT_1380265 [Mucor lusitanicus]